MTLWGNEGLGIVRSGAIMIQQKHTNAVSEI